MKQGLVDVSSHSGIPHLVALKMAARRLHLHQFYPHNSINFTLRTPDPCPSSYPAANRYPKQIKRSSTLTCVDVFLPLGFPSRVLPKGAQFVHIPGNQAVPGSQNRGVVVSGQLLPYQMLLSQHAAIQRLVLHYSKPREEQGEDEPLLRFCIVGFAESLRAGRGGHNIHWDLSLRHSTPIRLNSPTSGVLVGRMFSWSSLNLKPE